MPITFCMKRKNISFFILLTFLLGFFISCEEIDRSDRPFRYSSDHIVDGGTDTGVDDQSNLPKRPDDAVFLQAGSCACKNGKPIIVGNCASFCASKPNNAKEMLYMSVKVSEAIELSDLQDLYGWCTTVLVDPETGEALDGQANPGCVLEARDNQNNLKASIAFTPSAGSKNISIDISNMLNSNTNYRLTIKEVSSGAKSNTVQIYKVSEGNISTIEGPLWMSPVTRYTCFSRITTQDESNGNLYFDDAYRLHFYFIEEFRPDPISQSVGNLFCHDIFYYGPIDSELYPRLEETPNSITLWSNDDPRFYDMTGGENGASNGVVDVNDIILQNLSDLGVTLTGELNVFYPFYWPGAPELESEAGGNKADTPLGFYMVPWIDKSTFKSYCPTEAHYYSTNNIFKAMRDIIGVGTEALYIAKKEAKSILNEDGEYGMAPADYILIRESDVKNIWFYIENGQAYAPTQENISKKKIQFYWPADTSSPFVKKSHQRIYTIKGADELQNGSENNNNNGGANGDGSSNTSYPPHDKRIGCIPLASGS